MKIIYEILSPVIVTVGILTTFSFSDIVFLTLKKNDRKLKRDIVKLLYTIIWYPLKFLWIFSSYAWTNIIPGDMGGKWWTWNAPDNGGKEGNDGNFAWWFLIWSEELVSWPLGGTLFSTRWCSFAFTAKTETNVNYLFNCCYI